MFGRFKVKKTLADAPEVPPIEPPAQITVPDVHQADLNALKVALNEAAKIMTRMTKAGWRVNADLEAQYRSQHFDKYVAKASANRRVEIS